MKNKSGEKFRDGMLIVALAIAVSLFSFITEESDITGFAVAQDNEEIQIFQHDLLEFKDVGSLSTLAAGNYFVDSNGIVYWTDDESNPPIARVDFIEEASKNRFVYIDAEGRIGYVLESVLIENEE